LGVLVILLTVDGAEVLDFVNGAGVVKREPVSFADALVAAGLLINLDFKAGVHRDVGLIVVKIRNAWAVRPRHGLARIAKAEEDAGVIVPHHRPALKSPNTPRAPPRNPFVNLRPEPLSNLDEELNQHLPGELLRLHAQLGFTLLYVTHDRAEASDIGARIVCMRHDHVERTVSIEEF
jgi:hypothetical protein